MGELLDVSRLAGGRFVLTRTEQNLTALLRRVVELERATRPDRSIELSVPVRTVRGEVDANRLEQVLVNLLENAHKYSPAERPVRVRLRSGRQRVRILVEDDGIGIPPDDLPHVFEPFHRASNIDGNVSGLGLGLYIAREIARMHGGDLGVTSTPGTGSVFTVELRGENLPSARWQRLLHLVIPQYRTERTRHPEQLCDRCLVPAANLYLPVASRGRRGTLSERWPSQGTGPDAACR